MGNITRAVLCVVFVLCAREAVANTYMRDDVETGISSVYTVTINNGGGTFVTSTSEHFLGQRSMGMQYAGGSTTGMGKEFNFPWVANDIYMRYAVKFPSGFSFDPTSTKVARGWALPNPSPANDIVFIVRPKAGGGWKWSQFLNQEFAHGRPTNVDSSNGTLVPDDGAWHCIDAHYKWDVDGPGTGAYEIWIDGVQGWGATDRYMSTIPWTKIEVGGNFSSAPSPVTQTVYYDHIIIADAPFEDRPSDGVCHAWPDAGAWRVTQTVRPPKF